MYEKKKKKLNVLAHSDFNRHATKINVMYTRVHFEGRNTFRTVVPSEWFPREDDAGIISIIIIITT